MTDTPEPLDLRSHDIAADKMTELLRLFPEIRTEGGKIDFERLKLVLGETVDVGRERYGMNWPGKAECFKTIQAPSVATLLPCPEESVNFESTENLIIEGDNLEVLKLLQKAYLGKVKMIYIDPPYNTGNDFIYPDNYSESLQTYLEYTGQVDAQRRKFGTNTDTDGRFHSRWMNMMYPRLYLARNLLREDGVIFITIDDTELENLKRLCAEIFGEENFVGNIVWHKKRGKDNSAAYFSKVHDYILCFARNISALELNRLPLDDETKKAYRNPDGDKRGEYRVLGLWSRGGQGGSRYEYQTQDGYLFTSREWLVGLETMKKLDDEKRLVRVGDKLYRKLFIFENDGSIPETIWLDASNNANAADELKKLFDNDPPFDTPKPTPLIVKMLSIITDKESIVLDFFAGSGTTAQAVLEKNQEDQGKRKFILVQLPEKIENQSFSTIADITKERIRRAIKKINESEAGQLPLNGKQDRGFRVFKLAESNFKGWDTQIPQDAGALTRQLEMHIEHIREGRSSEDILYEILLKSGFPLTAPVETLELAGQVVYSVAGGGMLICLEKSLTIETIRAMAALKPARVVCLDAGFGGEDALKANAVQVFKSQNVVFKTV